MSKTFGSPHNSPRPRMAGRLMELPMGLTSTGPMDGLMPMTSGENLRGGMNFQVSPTQTLDPAPESRFMDGPIKVRGTKNLRGNK